ncbi:DNA-directed RNA polymerases III 12.5 kDa polypeptide [Aspergillus terreus NIH2624]|uniref:DNA-directed RNA polymerases III 12.5 kDa polypeptide n=1 Tax=Aspergillus terreus (strain NIH 2624 / FGSC A1156) TaxID=341663 RepID=Q0CTH3_ASPTN|nr:DNA-directed RNA polymerases III 12.5 kDa polypeptide [Aspergillus terreus NIH2624]EAU36285.1 DNA-directed RNA polymerases III 12.5 kDa polypeptide [Aspergillus terreus NIH2624]
MPLTFCPNCSNALTISRGEPTPRHPLGVNRFECRTCPYQYNLEQSYFEKTPMKQKEVEDVFGGKEEFANADSMAMYDMRCSVERELSAPLPPCANAILSGGW